MFLAELISTDVPFWDTDVFILFQVFCLDFILFFTRLPIKSISPLNGLLIFDYLLTFLTFSVTVHGSFSIAYEVISLALDMLQPELLIGAEIFSLVISNLLTLSFWFLCRKNFSLQQIPSNKKRSGMFRCKFAFFLKGNMYILLHKGHIILQLRDFKGH